ncbi:hypothetical protein OROMI_027771 [Orobanche minor]
MHNLAFNTQMGHTNGSLAASVGKHGDERGSLIHPTTMKCSENEDRNSADSIHQEEKENEDIIEEDYLHGVLVGTKGKINTKWQIVVADEKDDALSVVVGEVDFITINWIRLRNWVKYRVKYLSPYIWFGKRS